MAKDGVEEHISGLLEHTMSAFAPSHGKTDTHGRPLEEFRSDMLGYLGSHPDYQDLYKRALMERDDRRTVLERQRMVKEAL